MEEPQAADAPRYTRATLGTKSLQRLGLQLASGEPLSESEESLYQAFIVDADARRVAVQNAVDAMLVSVSEPIPRLAVQSTGRTKTRTTLVDKLRRDPRTKLPSIRDVAGVRVVADCSLVEMTLGVSVIKRMLGEDGPLRQYGFTGEARLIDRLAEPMHGYRALHLEVRLDGAPAEIQFRTQLQHWWAEFMELIGDRWGREHRYGLPLVEADPKVRKIKEEMVARMLDLSVIIATIEKATEPVGLAHLDFDAVSENGLFHFPQEEREEFENLRTASIPVLAEVHASVRELTSQLRTILDVLEDVTADKETP